MLYKNANIFVNGSFQYGSFRVENGRFTEILPAVPTEDGVDLEKQYVIPGLIDVHNHGNSGADFSDGDYDGLVKMARYLAANGVTSFAPASKTAAACSYVQSVCAMETVQSLLASFVNSTAPGSSAATSAMRMRPSDAS